MDIALARHEHFLFSKLRLKPGMRVLEVGCRSGTASFELVQFANVNVVGIESDPAKIEEANCMARNMGISNQLSFVTGDLERLQDYFSPESFDAIFSIESLRYLPSFDSIYGHLHDLLKPDGKLAIYEWCWTSSLDPLNQEHQRFAELIESLTKIGRRQPCQRSITAAVASLSRAQFHVVECEDRASRSSNVGDTPIEWYSPLEIAIGDSRINWSTTGQSSGAFGGLSKEAASAILHAGKFKLFTPMAMFVGQRA